jgi:hypothetical protein
VTGRWVPLPSGRYLSPSWQVEGQRQLLCDVAKVNTKEGTADSILCSITWILLPVSFDLFDRSCRSCMHVVSCDEEVDTTQDTVERLRPAGSVPAGCCTIYLVTRPTVRALPFCDISPMCIIKWDHRRKLNQFVCSESLHPMAAALLS